MKWNKNPWLTHPLDGTGGCTNPAGIFWAQKYTKIIKIN